MNTIGRATGVLTGVILAMLIVQPVSAKSGLTPDDLMIVEDGFEPGNGERVGEIALIEGNALIVHDKENVGYRIRESYPVFSDDTIITLEDARLRLKLNSGDSMYMAPETRIIVNKSIYTPKPGDRSVFVQFFGKVRFMVRKLSGFRRSEFKVKTKTAVIGVRGSDFIVHATNDMTEVSALDNTRLGVAGLAAPDKPVILESFQRSVVKKGMLPYKAESLIMDDVESLKQEFMIRPERSAPESDLTAIKPVIDRSGMRVPETELVQPGHMARTAASARIPELEKAKSVEMADKEEALTDERREIHEKVNIKLTPLPLPAKPEG